MACRIARSGPEVAVPAAALLGVGCPEMNARAFSEYEARLAEILAQLEAESSDNSVSSLNALEDLVRQADQDIPGVLPPFNADAMRGRWPAAFERYELSLLRPWIAGARVRLKKVPSTTILPVVSDLIFVSDPDLRKSLEADIAELAVAHAAGCLKSTVVLCGASIEALLTDALIQESPHRPDPPLRETLLKEMLGKLLQRAVDWQLIDPSAHKFSDAVREYRNLIHPGRTIRDQLTVQREEAQIAIEILNIVCRDLAARHRERTA
jgi:hypothetical protein